MNKYSHNNKLSDNDNPLMSSSSDSSELHYKKLLQILLVSCIAPNSLSPSGKLSMMPLAPTMTELPTAHRPKIGFSIDSIVGGGGRKDEDITTTSKSHHHDRSRRISSSADNNTPGSRSPTQTPPEERCSPDTPENRALGMSPLLAHLPKHHPHHPFLHHHLLNATEEKNGSLSPPMPRSVHPHHPHHHLLHPLHHQLRLPLLHHQQQPPQQQHSRSPVQSPGRSSSPSSTNNNKHNNDDTNSINSNSKDQDQVTSSRSPSPQCRDSPKTEVPSQSPEIHPPIQPHPGALGIPRPGFPPHVAGPHPPGMPPHFATYPPGMLNFAVAAAAAAQQQGHHPGIPGWMPGHPGAPHHPHHHAAAAHPLYPWLLAKQSRLFPHRFGPGPADLPGFLFQPFRKPKRIRTAFSPSQLLKLEHAFEKNHYVVGAERKQLAKSLSLSETQVKVWFQNRRTKHKRVEQEEDTIMKKPEGSRGHGSDLPSSGSNHSNSAISADSSTRNYSEEMSDDEEIVMDDEYSEEEEMDHGHHNMHHLSNSYS